MVRWSTIVHHAVAFANSVDSKIKVNQFPGESNRLQLSKTGSMLVHESPSLEQLDFDQVLNSSCKHVLDDVDNEKQTSSDIV